MKSTYSILGGFSFLSLCGLVPLVAQEQPATPPAAPATTGAAPAAPAPKTSFKFDFGAAKPAPGYAAVLPSTTYTAERGYGFETEKRLVSGRPLTVEFHPATQIQAVDRGGDALKGSLLTSALPFYFSTALPEGNYKVTVTFGDAQAASDNTVKAELRRLLLENVKTKPGEFVTKSFVVNVRRPEIPGSRPVGLKGAREAQDEFWAWDEKLTLEFNGGRPAVAAVEIEKVAVPTIFIVGDSTSCDQHLEPWSSWGQNFTNWFKPEVAVANHGESGESAGGSLAARRFDKVWSVMQPGDYLLVQFGHNDMKGSGTPEAYAANLQRIADRTQERGGKLIILSPVERSGGVTNSTLGAYPAAAKAVAEKNGLAFLDLHGASQTLYRAMGPDFRAAAFQDGTHHNNYGSYEVSKTVVALLQAQQHPLAQYVVAGFQFDPAKPDPVASFRYYPSAIGAPGERPPGDTPDSGPPPAAPATAAAQ